MNADELKNEAVVSDAPRMRHLLEEAARILKRERQKGETGQQKIKGGLVDLPPEGKAIVVGDLHGDLNSLTIILKESQFLKRVTREKTYLIFLGDYGDRGELTPEVYWVILKLKTTFPENLILLRGNHEPPPGLGVHPFDLPYFLKARYGRESEGLLQFFLSLFNLFPHALRVKEKYLMLHGGLPEKISSIEDIAEAHQTHPATPHLEQILWSDPGNLRGSYLSPRGAGIIFGEDISRRVLKLLNLKILIRSHQPCEGILVAHQGRVLTLFSRKGHPYHNMKAAYLDIDLSAPVKDAYQLSEKAHLF